MTGKRQLRVAIYTRKSTEEGLEQEFNSLDALREACEAYITSQRELGWKPLPARYDDGGLPGGWLARPALQQLLQDVRARRIDVIVVYKIDRLTRSLMDFSKIIAVFDEHDVSFVSVTQAFNTATSMGRLTLNMLLSFAQFEREVTAERIRDKIAASKAKGMWIGGVVPLGYEVKDRKLIVNQAEAETVRWLYQTYLEIGSVRQLKEEADRRGIVSKRRKGTNPGGRPLTRGHLYRLLSNPLYAGKVTHKGNVHDGRHQPIIDSETFEQVQALLKENADHRRISTNVTQPHLLTGVLYDETGDRLSPSHATKKGRRYRYYVSHRLMQARRKNGDGWRLPADPIERIVVEKVTAFLGDRRRLLKLAEIDGATVSIIRTANRTLDRLTDRLRSASGKDRREILRSLVHRITLKPQQIAFEISRKWLVDQLTGSQIQSILTDEAITLEIPMQLRQKGVEAKIILEKDDQNPRQPDPVLVQFLGEAHHYREALLSGSSLADLAKSSGRTSREIGRILPLAFLAPDIVKTILDGRQPAGLSVHELKRARPLPIIWADQRKRLGFEV
jgi:site-specific DNA recombinase